MYIDRTRLDDALAHLPTIHGSDRSVESVLEQLTESVMALFGLSGAGLLLADADAVVRPVLATDHQGWALEAGQEAAGEGPCIASAIHGELVSTRDVTSDDRWPKLAAELAHCGIGGVLGVPVRLGSATIGALNVYVDESHDWDDSEIAALRSYGRFVETLLGTALLAERQEALVEQLQEALDTRVPIERAIGLLMGRHGLDAVSAFNRLRSRARTERRRVVDIARELLDDVRSATSAD